MENDKEKRKSIILLVQGGCGDIIAATPMIRSFRKKYPEDEIIVLCTYKQVLENNPNIDILVPLNEPKDFYSEFVLGRNVRFFKKHFIYDQIMDELAVGCKSLCEFICKVYDTEYDGNPPDYFVTDYEKRFAEGFFRQSKKEKVLLHIYGAVPSDGNYSVYVCGMCGGSGMTRDGKCKNCGGSGKIVSRSKTNGLKDLNPKKLENLVKKYSDRFDFLQIGLEGEPLVPGTFDCLGMPMRDTIALIPYCASFIFIESLFAHAAACLGKKGVVVFNNTSPFFFGYENSLKVYNKACGCDLWPCNRPVGALIDLYPGYKNPKTRDKVLWECPDQKCSDTITQEMIEEQFILTIKENKPVSRKFDSLEAARKG